MTTKTVYEILPHNVPGPHRTGTLTGVTYNQIVDALGFHPNANDDDEKVKNSWGFTFNGTHCGIWDYKGHCWSCYGPKEIFVTLFGDKSVE